MLSALSTTLSATVLGSVVVFAAAPSGQAPLSARPAAAPVAATATQPEASRQGAGSPRQSRTVQDERLAALTKAYDDLTVASGQGARPRGREKDPDLAGRSPRIVCGMTVLPVDPALDADIRRPAADAGGAFTPAARRLIPTTCHE